MHEWKKIIDKSPWGNVKKYVCQKCEEVSHTKTSEKCPKKDQVSD